MEYYSALKRGEALTPATTWTRLERRTLSERRQTRKATRRVIPLTGQVQNRRVHGDRGRAVSGRQGQGAEGDGESLPSNSGSWSVSKGMGRKLESRR